IAVGAPDLGREGSQVRIDPSAVAEIANCPVQLAIGADSHGAAIMILAAGGQIRNDDGFGRAHVTDSSVTDDLLFTAGDGDKYIHVTVHRETGIKADPDQAAFVVEKDGA